MRKKFAAVACLLLLILTPATAITSGTFVELQSRSGISQAIYVIKPASPVATVILLPGGTGKIKIGPDGPKKEGNFLVRTRDLFVNNELLAIVVDAPSDLLHTKKGLRNQRITDNNVTDIKAIVAYARKQANIPIWLVGTSRGTITASHVAASAPNLVNGIILTATVSRPPKKGGDSVMDTNLENIAVPVLLAHHNKDHCRVSLSKNLNSISERLTNAPRVDTKLFTGGNEVAGKECKGSSFHGFYKIENEVVTYISNWIKLR
jgi:predicted esterase